jgi:hypothetical protein
MKKFILSVAVVGLSVGLAAAGPKSGGNGGGNGPKGNGPSGGSGPSSHTVHSGGSMPGSWKGGSGSGHDFVQKYAKSFGGGFCYPGKGHSHWTYSCYSKKFGCSCYWCPYTSCYYYWCEPACCYYPITYIAVAPPTPCVTCAAPAQVQTQTQVQVQTQTQTQGPPAGIPPLPE